MDLFFRYQRGCARVRVRVRARARVRVRPDGRSTVRSCARPRDPSAAPVRRVRVRVRARVHTHVRVRARVRPDVVQPCAVALDRAIRLRPQFDVSVSAPVHVPVSVPVPFLFGQIM